MPGTVGRLRLESPASDQIIAATTPFGIGMVQSTDDTIFLDEAQARALNNTGRSISTPSGGSFDRSVHRSPEGGIGAIIYCVNERCGARGLDAQMIIPRR